MEATDGGTVLMQATYVYDAFGQRVEKDVWTASTGTVVSRFAYDQGNVWADLNGSNQLQTRRLYLDGVDSVFARISSGGTAAWYLTDRLGSIRDITDQNGNVIDHIDYDGFGNVTNETQTANGDRYKWTGREFDSATGLQFNRARYYSPTDGRWTTQDPIGFAAGDSNLQRYAGNDPTNRKDAAGTDDEAWYKPWKWTWRWNPLVDLVTAPYNLVAKYNTENANVELAKATHHKYYDRGYEDPTRPPSGGTCSAYDQTKNTTRPTLDMEWNNGLRDVRLGANVVLAWDMSAADYVMPSGVRFAFSSRQGKWVNKTTGEAATAEEVAALNEARDKLIQSGPPRITRGWPAYKITDPRFENGCEKVAKQISGIIGGKRITIRPRGWQTDPKLWLGAYRGHTPGEFGWAFHEVVVKNGRVYDAFTGSKGLLIEEYKALWENATGIEFGF